MILECPFTSFSAMAGNVVPWVGRFFARGFNSRRKIGAIGAPLLIIHGDRDRTVPYAMGKQLFEAAREPKAFWTVEGATHRDIVAVAGEQYTARLHRFFAGLVAGRAAGSERPRS